MKLVLVMNFARFYRKTFNKSLERKKSLRIELSVKRLCDLKNNNGQVRIFNINFYDLFSYWAKFLLKFGFITPSRTTFVLMVCYEEYII